MTLHTPQLFLVALAALVSTALIRADEGMWLYSAPPREAIKAKYGFDLTDTWLQHLMRSSVRFNSGGSGSFVSADGLVITNHHVGADDLQKLGDAQHNYLRDGFYAATPAEEKKCVDLELNVLQSIEDVTARVNAAVPTAATDAGAAEARRKVIAEIERESLRATGLRSDVVTLYQGGAYHLYRYKRYTDVRLVFAPEEQIAFFGGDPDNFEFPRYDLDICIFRVYENGRPADTKDFLKFSTAGSKEGDLTFVSGHPGSTDRQDTMAELAFWRDVQIPYLANWLKRREVALRNWSDRSEENARRARNDFLYVQNSRKVYDGRQEGLYSPSILDRRQHEEDALRQRLRNAPNAAAALTAFDRIATAVGTQAKLFVRERLLEGDMRSFDAFRAPYGFNCRSYAIARALLRAADERPKPDGERLRDFSEARRQSLELQLFSDEPIYADYETLELGDSLTQLTEQLGYDDPLVQKVLAGQSPRDRAAALVHGTHVGDVAVRHRLYEGGERAIRAANDPMIELARLIDPEARAVRQAWEAADEVRQQGHAAIEKARFALEGPARAPDATFTLRLSYGPVAGYEQQGAHIPAFTTFAGLYERSAQHHDREPFDLPERWVARRSQLDPTTPFNFVSTADIIGGNSGSPTVNTAGEFVGIIFDGNVQSLVLDYAYDDKQARAVSVDSRAILEALKKVYVTDALVQELVDGHR